MSRWAAIAAVVGIAGILLFAVFWFFRLAPPRSITITTGPEGSMSQINAQKYRKILWERNRVELKILPSEGSAENLKRLNDESMAVDIGFVQSGVTNDVKSGNIMSLGSVTYQPLLVFYRANQPVTLLSQLKGKRLAIGPVGSGTRGLALTLLKMNGIEPGADTVLSDAEAEQAAKELLEGELDAAFMMGDSASPQLMRKLLLTPEVQLMSFAQADAYTRKVTYLNRLELPMGSLDFGANIPKQDAHLIGPTVELLARKNLHPALSDLLLEAAQEVHGSAGLLRRKGEFPSLLEQEYPISQEAVRYHKSGKGFLYQRLPFWLASVVNRFLLVFVPVFVLLIPAVKVIPAALALKTKLRFYRWYRALLLLEYDLRREMTPERRKELQVRLEGIAQAVNHMKVPASYADQFYGLREHVEFVRERLTQS
jgi:TRAP-type uncharacterized transport system substrate-binding protein